MTDTSDFVSRLRIFDRVSIIVQSGDVQKLVEGVISKQWSNGTIKCNGFVIRAWDYKINEDILAIRYSKLGEMGKK